MSLTKDEVETLEKIAGQMEGLHKEVGALARKSPNDGLNKFKLRFINSVLTQANQMLGQKYKPFSDSSVFEEDDVPTNSDVAFIVGQYMEEIERRRADDIKRDPAGGWIYDVSDAPGKFRTAPPKKIQERK